MEAVEQNQPPALQQQPLPHRPAEPQRSVGELFGELATETRTLLRQEIQLARTELTAKAKSAGKEASYIAIGGVLGFIGLELLLGAAALALGLVLPLWASLVVLGVVVAGVAFGLYRHGVSALRRIDLSPTETLLSIEDNKTWAKKQIQ